MHSHNVPLRQTAILSAGEDSEDTRAEGLDQYITAAMLLAEKKCAQKMNTQEEHTV
jgi:hypothetical protein